MKKFLPAIILTISLLPGMAFADTHAAADCAQATVAAAVAAATAGDTVTIPACAATTWDDPVTIDKNLTISGDSPTTTTLRTNDEASVAADGIFIIADNVVAYIKNIGFTTTVPVDTNAFNAPIWFNGDSHTGSVIYNCKFDGHKWAIFGWDLSGVVISKNAFIDGGIQLYGPAAASWSAALGLGGDDWTFIEGNTFTVQRAQAVHIVLGYSGAKYVVRYNTISSVDGTYFIADAVDAHGYGHASGGTYGRSTRGWDVYNNLFEKKGSESRGIFLRGGSGTAHHNVFNEITGGAYDKSEIRIQDERLRVTTMNSGPQDGTSATCGTPTAGVNLSCQASEGDPCCDMIGRGANQTSDPAYFWSNYKCTSAPCLSNLTAITPTVEDGGSGYIGLGTDYYNSEKSGYTQKACVHPSVTDLSGKSCDTTLYGTSGYGIDSAHDVTPSATNCTISPAAVQTITSGNTTTFTMTAPYGYDASGSGCGGTLSSGTYTTSAITADCTVTCTGLGKRGVLGGTGTVSLGGSGVATLGN